jgi:hypothetical protein
MDTRSDVRKVVDEYLNSLELRPKPPIQGIVRCPHCQAALHFTLYPNRRLEARCTNHCPFFGNL